MITVKITGFEPLASDYVYLDYEGDINEAKEKIDLYFSGDDYEYSYTDENSITIRGNIDLKNLTIGKI